MMQPQNQPQTAQTAVTAGAYSYASFNVTKTRQLVMVYDGLISSILQARKAIEEDNPEGRFNHLQKACTIVIGLQAALDHERGKEISEMLDNFYFSVDARLMRLNRNPNLGELDRVLAEVRTMRDAWVEVDAAATAAGQDGDINKFSPSAETLNNICVSA